LRWFKQQLFTQAIYVTKTKKHELSWLIRIAIAFPRGSSLPDSEGYMTALKNTDEVARLCKIVDPANVSSPRDAKLSSV
jgi:hypothetical protein